MIPPLAGTTPSAWHCNNDMVFFQILMDGSIAWGANGGPQQVVG